MKAYLPSGLLGSLLLLFSCTAPPVVDEPGIDPGPHVTEVSEVAALFLSALSAPDTSTLSRLMAPGAMIYSVREGEAGPSLRAVTREDFLESLGGEEQELLERMWDPEVQVQDRVAMVWTPYDFHLNGEFSHCGIDVFTMLEGTEGWQVTSITYNVVREGCGPSPLGSPKGSER